MKLRLRLALVSSSALALTAAPAALTAAGLGALPFSERASFAQGAPPPAAPAPAPAPTPAPAPADGVTEVARLRYQEGVKAFDAGRYEEARAAFLQAYALKRTPAVLLNVALSELRAPTNHADEAGNHFQQFLREVPAATPEQRATAEKGIADAKRRAGVIAINVDAAGADVSIDGTSIGKAPIHDPVFVKPGKHTVFAQYQGHNAAVIVDVKLGGTATATLTTGVTGAPPPATPATPAPGSAAPPTTAPAPGAPGPATAPPAPPTASPPGAAGATPGGATPPSATPPGAYAPGSVSGSMGTMPGGPDQTASDREPFFHWYKRKPLAWVGTGVTGIGLIGGIVFTSIAAATSKATSKHAQEIKTEDANHPEFNPDRRANICGDSATGAGALAHYADACATLRTDVSVYHTDVALAATGWALFGVGLVGTTIYAMVDWYPKKASQETAFQPRVLGVAPIVAPGQRGIGIVGSF